jgi:hypothetical protein
MDIGTAIWVLVRLSRTGLSKITFWPEFLGLTAVLGTLDIVYEG